MGGFISNPYITDNPILKAYTQGVQMRREQEMQQANIAAKQEEQKLAREHLKSYNEQLKNEAAFHAGSLQAEQARNQMEATKMVAAMVASGQLKSGAGQPIQAPMGQPQGPVGNTYQDTLTQGLAGSMGQPMAPQSGMAQAPQNSVMGVDPSQFNNPEAIARLKALSTGIEAPAEASAAGLKAGAITKAQTDIEFPQQTKLAEAKAANERLLKEQEEKAAKDLRTQEDAAKMAQVIKSNEGARAVAGIRANATIMAARIGKEVTPDQLVNESLLQATGQASKPLGNTVTDRAIRLGMDKQGFVPMTGKEAEAVKNLHGLDPLYEEMKGFISKLPDSQIGAIGQGLASHIPASDLANFKAKVVGVSGNIARSLGAENGRLTQQDISRAINLLVTPGITKAQAIDRIKFFEAETRSKLLDQALGGQKPKQQLLNVTTYGFDPAQYNGTIAYKGKQVPRFKQDPTDGEWLAFNATRGGYESLDAGK